MIITIIGCGYVGLVTGSCFAEMGHTVACIDTDKRKIAMLHNEEIPIYEPGLQEIVQNNVRFNRLSFHSQLTSEHLSADAVFLALPTPPKESGEADLSIIRSVCNQIGTLLHNHTVFVLKSTAPVGTTENMQKWIAETMEEKQSFDIASNPEFLKEGAAIQDCLKPDRVVIGCKSPHAEQVLRQIYSPFTLNSDRILFMDIPSSELTKYASNAMLATRISFMNEMAEICEKTGANIVNIRKGMGADKRIGPHFLYAGAGFGGSCFPKDLKALFATAKKHNIPLRVVKSVLDVNENQKNSIYEKIRTHFFPMGLKDAVIGILGLSFKPDTDDIREAPSLYLLASLLQEGATVRAFDPAANKHIKNYFQNHPNLILCDDEYQIAKSADAMVLMTEWKQFRSINLNKIKALMNGNAFFDARNQYDPATMIQLGFNYCGIGINAAQKKATTSYAGNAN